MQLTKYFIMLCVFIFAGCSSLNQQPINSCVLKELVSSNIHLFTNRSWIEKTPLKGGLSDSNLHKVSDGQNSYIIRTISHRSREDKIREIQAQKIASEQGYGPHLYAYDLEKGLIIMSVLAKADNFNPSVNAVKLSSLLKKIHNGPAFCDNGSIITLIKHRFKKTKNFPKGIDLNILKLRIGELENAKPLFTTATHRDLNPNNVMMEHGELKTIDFENSGQDDPFFDVATVCIFNFSNPKYENEFLRHYFGHPVTGLERSHLNKMKRVAYLFYGLEILSKISPQSINQKVISMDFNEAFEALKKGNLSLDREGDILILAKSMLTKALERH